MACRRDRFQMEFTDDPNIAVELYSEQKFDVVVSDLNMPQRSGLSLVRQFMESDVTGQTRFMFLTGSNDFDVAVQAINELQIYRFLQKPIARDLLLDAIEEALKDAENERSVGGRHAAAALEMINAAVLVLSEQKRLKFANPAGKLLLQSGDSLLLDANGICRARTSEENRVFCQTISQALSSNEQGVHWLTFMPDDFGRCRSWVVMPRLTPENETSVVMLSSDIDAPSELSVEALQSLFGLTPAEAQLTLALSRGERIQTAASISGLTVSSARTYLKRVFVKTGVDRQSDLVKKVLSSPAAWVRQQS